MVAQQVRDLRAAVFSNLDRRIARQLGLASPRLQHGAGPRLRLYLLPLSPSEGMKLRRALNKRTDRRPVGSKKSDVRNPRLPVRPHLTLAPRAPKTNRWK
jgi:hypothetical protein